MYNKSELLNLCKKLGVVRHGRFELASGRSSNIYLDMRNAILHSGASRLIVQGLWSLLDEHFPDVEAIGGMGYGATPLVGAMLASSKRDVYGFLVRKDIKGYGTQNLIEGNVVEGMKTCLVEDVTTTGGSLLSAAIKAGYDFSPRPQLAVTVVDRGEGAIEMLAKQGIKLVPLLSMADLTND